jgi:sulfate adenylyltransferase subunit 1 (EFTu-like GTPase family)
VQDIYKFTEQDDDRRIVAGTIETGSIAVGDAVVFQPSGKSSRIRSVEYFNGPAKIRASAGEASGFTLDTQLYIKPGEWMVRADEPALQVGTRLRVNLFWMNRAPMICGKTYKLKLGALRSTVKLVEILAVLDAAEIGVDSAKQQVDRHDVAEVILETPKPVAFDLIGDIEQTGRLVIVDNFEIAGAGIILAKAETVATTSETPLLDPAGAHGNTSKFAVSIIALSGVDNPDSPALKRLISQNAIVTMKTMGEGGGEPASLETVFKLLKQQGFILDYQI